jgi:BatD DUF11 like domain
VSVGRFTRTTLLWLCLWPLAAFAAPQQAGDTEFTAAVDREEIGLDESVRYDLTVTFSSKGDQGELSPPAFKDWDVVGRSSAEQASFTFSGSSPAFRRTTVTSYTLSPHKAGQLQIEPARLTVKGRVLTTAPVTVKVLASGQQASPRRGQQRAQADEPQAAPGIDPFLGVRANAKDLTLKATVDLDQPVVGQQVTWTLWLLARVTLSGLERLQLPKMDGFWTEELEQPQQLVSEARVVDGVPMQAYLLRKRALFPLRPGKVTIDPAEVEVVTGMGALFSRSNVRRESQPLTLEVQPLPAGAPAGFDAGNVGQWQLSASAEPIAVAVGQAVTLKVVARGRGNLRDLQLPKLPAIPGLRAYDATSTDKPGNEQGRAGGTRTVEQLLVPERTGELEVPALTMETFDPLSRQYKAVKTSPLRITVGPAAAGSAQGQAAQNLLAAGGMRPVRLHLRTQSSGAPPWERGWFWPALLLAPVLVGGGLFASRLGKAFALDPSVARVQRAAQAARKRLQGAEALLEQQKTAGEDPGPFYAEVQRALAGYLQDKQGVSVAGLTREELARSLLEKGHSKVTCEKLSALLDECDRARFAPGAGTTAAQQAVLQRADAVLASLDNPKSVRKEGP